MEYVKIAKDTLESMFEMMEYQSLVIAAMYEKFKPIKAGQWITTEKAAELLNVSTRKIRMMKNMGHLGFIKHGRKCFYRSDDVNSHIKKDNIERNL